MNLKQSKQVPNTQTSSDHSSLKAVLFNTSLKKDSSESHTQLLLNAVAQMMETSGVQVEHIHVANENIAPGIYPDMTEHGYESDGWPKVWERVKASDILILGTPIWLGEESSLCRVLIERLYAMSGELNEKGQSIFYNKVGGCVITGNEDGIKHVAMTIAFALNHLGLTIPPQADCGWIGEAGPGASYGDEGEDGKRAGFDNEFTQRNTTIMTWNLLHLAKMLKDAGGIPSHGNDREAWKNGERFGFQNPEHTPTELNGANLGQTRSPEEIVTDTRLTSKEKLTILKQWKHDQTLMAEAVQEGMPGPEPELLRRINNALQTLDH